jgi:hypothetical protein
LHRSAIDVSNKRRVRSCLQVAVRPANPITIKPTKSDVAIAG